MKVFVDEGLKIAKSGMFLLLSGELVEIWPNRCHHSIQRIE